MRGSRDPRLLSHTSPATGPSGAGSRWRIAVMRPGGAPLDKLAEALAQADVLGSHVEELRATLTRTSLGLIQAVRDAQVPAGDSVLVVVDQFEELFRFRETLDDDGTASELFVRLLLEACDQPSVPIYVVLTMRSEFLSHCTGFLGLPEALNESQYLIPRLTRRQRKEAIEGPARLAGGTIEPQLVQRLLNDVGEEPDQLPVMQHALRRTFEVWGSAAEPSEPIGLEHYDVAGHLELALHLHATRVYEDLSSDEHRDIAQTIFRCLTTLQDGVAVRRPTEVSQLMEIVGAVESPPRQLLVREVIADFMAEDCSFPFSSDGERLAPEAVLDISHESLIRKWRQLRNWVAEEAQSAAYYRDVCRETVLYEKGDAKTLRGPKLRTCWSYLKAGLWNQAWASQYRKSVPTSFDHARAFLSKSRRTSFLFRGVATVALLALLTAGFVTLRANARAARAERVVQESNVQIESYEQGALEAELRAEESRQNADALQALLDGLRARGTIASAEVDQLKATIQGLEASSTLATEQAESSRKRLEGFKEVVQESGDAHASVTEKISDYRKRDLQQMAQVLAKVVKTGYMQAPFGGLRLELSWANLDLDKLGYDRRLAAWTPNLREQPVQVVTEGSTSYVRSEFEGRTRELSWASLDKDRLADGGRLAAWTPNLGKQPVQMVTERGQSYIRTEIEGLRYELNWAKHDQDRLSGDRRLAAWLPILSRQPIRFEGGSGGDASRIDKGPLLTDGAYYWVLNGDGSRNWLRSAPPCRAQAERIARSEVDRIPKRHGGDNADGYGLDPADASRICANSQGVAPKLVTNGTHYWIVNADGSRNWIEDVSSDCRERATRISDVEQFPKRHGGSGGYTLKGSDARLACSI